MARSEGIKIVGLRETVRDLERLGVAVEDLKTAFGQISDDVTREAQGIVRVASGALRGSIRPARTKNKAVVRAGNAGVQYAGVNNYGRDGVSGTGFLTTPANSDPEGKARQIEDNLRDLIRRYGLD